jgi:hypothetical protein
MEIEPSDGETITALSGCSASINGLRRAATLTLVMATTREALVGAKMWAAVTCDDLNLNASYHVIANCRV